MMMLLKVLKFILLTKQMIRLILPTRISFLGYPGFELKNRVLAFTDFYLHDVPFEEMNDSPKLTFDFLLVNANKKKADHFEASLKIKARQLVSEN